MTYDQNCDCPRCNRQRTAWTPFTGARWRLAALTITLALLVALTAASRADSQPAGRCAEVRAYVAPNLPSRFVAIAWRESNCRNDVANGCCGGWWQIHRVTFQDAQGRAIAASCGQANWHNIQGDSVGAKLRQVCVARGLYLLRGLDPWAL